MNKRSFLFTALAVLLAFYKGTGQTCYNPIDANVNVSLYYAHDHNKDGNIDLISTSGKDINWYWGQGDYTFTKTTSTIYNNFENLTFGDFNGDTKLDYGVLTDDDYFTVYLAGGSPNYFVATISYLYTGNIIAGDFNHDTKLDLLAIQPYYNGGTWKLYTGKGDGTFNTPVTNVVNNKSNNLSVDYFDGDVYLDIVTSNKHLFTGDASGNFTDKGLINYNGWGVYPYNYDVNNDAKNDLIFSGADTLSVLLGNGDGTFQDANKYSCKNITNASFSVYGSTVSFGDLNNDNKTDILTFGINENDIVIFFGNGDGTFTEGPRYSTVQGRAVAVIDDYNNDNLNDFLVYGGGATFMINSGSTLSPPTFVNDTITYCKDATATALEATGSNLTWTYYENFMGDNWVNRSSDAPTPLTNSVKVYDYNVDQTVGGCQSALATVVVTVEDCATEVSDPVKEHMMKFYPVPADNHLTVELSEIKNDNSKIEILDLNGKVVQQQVMIGSICDIDISKLLPGMYLLKVKNSDQVLSKTFVK